MCSKPTQARVKVGCCKTIEANYGDGLYISIEEGYDSAGIELTKQQARKFAKQILEMTGDEDESVQ